jgi:hypothetical protein
VALSLLYWTFRRLLELVACGFAPSGRRRSRFLCWVTSCTRLWPRPGGGEWSDLLCGEFVFVQHASEPVATAEAIELQRFTARRRFVYRWWFRERSLLVERPVRPVPVVCPGINRHGEGVEGALDRRSSDPRWPRVMRWRS